jgi:hypothetical protein
VSFSLASAEQPDEFDALVLALGSDQRAAPSDPLLTPEAIAKAEQERLKQLEVSIFSSIS